MTERQKMRAVAAGFATAMIERESAMAARMEQNLSAANAAMAEAAKDPFVKGSTGQLREHPGFKIAARCDEIALRLYRTLTAGQDELIEETAAALR